MFPSLAIGAEMGTRDNGCDNLTRQLIFSWYITSKQSWARKICLASRQRQRDNVTEPQGPGKIPKIVGPQFLDGVATTKIVKWQIQTLPLNMVCKFRGAKFFVVFWCIAEACRDVKKLTRAQLCTRVLTPLGESAAPPNRSKDSAPPAGCCILSRAPPAGLLYPIPGPTS